MEVKPTVVVLITLTLMVNLVVADFFFNHPLIKKEQVDGVRYKCLPGRTVIKVTQYQEPMALKEETDSEEYRLRTGRKHHMSAPVKDESCQMCVCSAEGSHEHCSNRPSENINECLYVNQITNRFGMALPFEHAKDLSNRIRRGLCCSAGGHKT